MHLRNLSVIRCVNFYRHARKDILRFTPQVNGTIRLTHMAYIQLLRIGLIFL